MTAATDRARRSSRKLTLDDIADARAYERERAEFRARVIEVKARRRVSLGPILTVMFESRDTMRLQVQEMARVEHILTDEGIQEELDAYNPLIPEPGELCATVFLELTSDEEMREWLPRLVGIERSLQLRVGPDATVVPAAVDEGHASQLTRETVTAAVHYVRWELSPDQVEAVAAGPVVLATDHPEYRNEAVLAAATVAELLADLRPDVT
jgi:hypothetical protein